MVPFNKFIAYTHITKNFLSIQNAFDLRMSLEYCLYTGCSTMTRYSGAIIQTGAIARAPKYVGRWSLVRGPTQDFHFF